MNSRIKQAREHAKLTQAMLAKLVGVKRSSSNQWESVVLNKEPSTANLVKIAMITGVSLEWLATGRGEMLWQNAGSSTTSDYAALSAKEKHLIKLFSELSERKQKAVIEFLVSN